jgi:hypothetical protein
VLRAAGASATLCCRKLASKRFLIRIKPKAPPMARPRAAVKSASARKASPTMRRV